MNRTVITGYGIMSCLGHNNLSVRASLLAGESGIVDNPEFATIGLQSTFQGEIPVATDLQMLALSPSQLKTMGEESVWAFCAAREAMDMAGLYDTHRTALIVSNDSTAKAHRLINNIMDERHDTRYLRSNSVFHSLNSTVSMNLAQIFNIGGLSLTVSAACAGGGHAIGIAHSLIRSGAVNCAIVVGAQEMGPNAFMAFDALGVFAKEGDPKTASRPFSYDRQGLVPSGGAACVILESERYARERNASRMIATIDGYGFSTSPHIITPNAYAECGCMLNAIADSCILPSQIDMVAAHATGTSAGDQAEQHAIHRIFADTNDHYHVTATKALTGHECWMAGVSQVVYALHQMDGRFIAPYRHFAGLSHNTQSSIPLAPEGLRDIDIRHILCNAFGFGGTNSSLVISKYE